MREKMRSEFRIQTQLVLIVAGILLILALITTAFMVERYGRFRSYHIQTSLDLRGQQVTLLVQDSVTFPEPSDADSNIESEIEPDSAEEPEEFEESAEESVGGSTVPNSPATIVYPADWNPEIGIEDDQGAWTADVAVEIFKITYSNEDGEFNVIGANGDKVLAPGASNSYTFRIRNTGNVAMQYLMTAEASFGDSQIFIPVELRLSDYEGNYWVGSEESWEPALDLNMVSIEGDLEAEHYDLYTLEWMWAFEGSDEYDTYLGDLATEEDITLTIAIHTVATESTEPLANGAGGIPDTGDTDKLLRWGLVASVTLLLLLLLLYLRNRRDEKTPQV